MPFDRISALKDANGAESAYSRTPHSQFFARLAGHIKEACAVIDHSALEVIRAQNETVRLERLLDEEKTHYRKLREQNANTEQMVAVLREIAENPKGAQKKAAEIIAILAPEPIVTAPAPTIAQQLHIP